MNKLAVSLTLLLVTFGALASESPVVARGNAFQEVESLADVPSPIQDALGVSDPGLEGVADKDQPFNATDVVDESLPRRRFLTAGREGDLWLVALEHGGRGYNVQAYLYSGDGELRQHWVLRGKPTTFKAVLAAIPEEQPHK